MIGTTNAVAAPCSDASSLQRIGQSLHKYEADLRLDVPKADTDHMQAMCAVAKCSTHWMVASVLNAHVDKRKHPKQPVARYRFSAALETYATQAQTSFPTHVDPVTAQRNRAFIEHCMLRAERNLLKGFVHDPHHAYATEYFKNNTSAAPWTLRNVASRVTCASLRQTRLPPAVYAMSPIAPAPAPSLAAMTYTLATPSASLHGCLGELRQPGPGAPLQATDQPMLGGRSTYVEAVDSALGLAALTAPAITPRVGQVPPPPPRDAPLTPDGLNTPSSTEREPLEDPSLLDFLDTWSVDGALESLPSPERLGELCETGKRRGECLADTSQPPTTRQRR